MRSRMLVFSPKRWAFSRQLHTHVSTILTLANDLYDMLRSAGNRVEFLAAAQKLLALKEAPFTSAGKSWMRSWTRTIASAGIAHRDSGSETGKQPIRTSKTSTSLWWM